MSPSAPSAFVAQVGAGARRVACRSSKVGRRGRLVGTPTFKPAPARPREQAEAERLKHPKSKLKRLSGNPQPISPGNACCKGLVNPVQHCRYKLCFGSGCVYSTGSRVHVCVEFLILFLLFYFWPTQGPSPPICFRDNKDKMRMQPGMLDKKGSSCTLKVRQLADSYT